jgi:hypothetical protein
MKRIKIFERIVLSPSEVPIVSDFRDGLHPDLGDSLYGTTVLDPESAAAK